MLFTSFLSITHIHTYTHSRTTHIHKYTRSLQVGRSRMAAQRWKECEILVIDEIWCAAKKGRIESVCANDAEYLETDGKRSLH